MIPGVTGISWRQRHGLSKLYNQHFA